MSDHLWPKLWKQMGKNVKLKEKQKWAEEKIHLDNARKLRGIYFIDPEDKEIQKTIKNARKKLKHESLLLCLSKFWRKNVEVVPLWNKSVEQWKFQHSRSEGDRPRETLTLEKARTNSTAESPNDTSEVHECMFCEVLDKKALHTLGVASTRTRHGRAAPFRLVQDYF